MYEDKLRELFSDEGIRERVQEKLPLLFKMAELQVSRGGKVGMEVGVLREQIIIALLMYKFGRENVDTDIPADEREIDVILKGHRNPISIKTKSGSGYSGIKLIWTVDWTQVEDFYDSYLPKTDMLFAHVLWGKGGVFAYVPLEVQRKVFTELGKDKYIKLPKKGGNPRGVEISSYAMRACLEHSESMVIPINWVYEGSYVHDPYSRWVELWARE